MPSKEVQGKRIKGKGYYGGKIKDEGSLEGCLKRELGEKSGIQVEVAEFITSNKHHYETLTFGSYLRFLGFYLGILNPKIRPSCFLLLPVACIST